MGNFQLFPEQASTLAPEVDHLLYFLLAVTVFFTVLIFGAILLFRHPLPAPFGARTAAPSTTGYTLEILWTVIPFGLTMVMFTWGASIFFTASRPPNDAIQIYVVGKQWMWKLQHLEGQREINELHIPVGRPVRLTMTSEDVIHSFFVPAFRTKQDVVPGRYSTTWFTAHQARQVSPLLRRILRHQPLRHDRLGLRDGAARIIRTGSSGGAAEGSLAENGKKLFEQLACSNCHKEDNSGRCPTLVGLFGKQVQLAGGGTVKADEAYIRESILQPQAKVVAGYRAGHAHLPGTGDRRQVLQLVEYVKSLGPKPGTGPADSLRSRPKGRTPRAPLPPIVRTI